MSISSSTEPRLRIKDNPIMIAQTRRRVRPKPFFTIIGIVGTICLFFLNTAPMVVTAKACLFIVGGLLFVRATAEVAAAVLFDRTSGLIDFHRSTPTTPLTDAVGYVVGSAAREYAGAATAGLCAIFAMTSAGASLVDSLLILAVLFGCAFTYQSFGLFAGLVFNKTKVAKGFAPTTIIIILMITNGVGGGMLTPLFHLTPLPALAELGLYGETADKFTTSVAFFGLEIAPLLYTLVIQTLFCGFFLACACRKLVHAEAVSIERKTGLAFVGAFLILMVGALWPMLGEMAPISELSSTAVMGEDIERAVQNGRALWGLGMILVIGMVLSALFLCIQAPRPLHASRALRREKAGKTKGLAWIGDGAPVLKLLQAYVGILWVISAVSILRAMDGDTAKLFQAESLLLFVAIPAVLGMAAYGMTYARMVSRTRRGSLYTFLLLAGPFLLAMVLGLGGTDGQTLQYIMAISPLTALFGAPFLALSSLFAGLDLSMEVVGVSVAINAVMAYLAYQKTQARWAELRTRIS